MGITLELTYKNGDRMNLKTLKTKRKKKKMTQETVAKGVGLSLYAYQLIERGTTKNPHPNTIKKLNAFFEVGA